jgi:hypothetical protein
LSLKLNGCHLTWLVCPLPDQVTFDEFRHLDGFQKQLKLSSPSARSERSSFLIESSLITKESVELPVGSKSGEMFMNSVGLVLSFTTLCLLLTVLPTQATAEVPLNSDGGGLTKAQCDDLNDKIYEECALIELCEEKLFKEAEIKFGKNARPPLEWLEEQIDKNPECWEKELDPLGCDKMRKDFIDGNCSRHYQINTKTRLS